MKRFLLAVLAAASLGCASAAHAQERELTRQHDGSVSAFVGLGGEFSSIVVADCFFCTGSSVNPDGTIKRARTIDGPDAILDVGGSIAVGQSGGEFMLRGRLVFLSPARGESLMLGYRKYWGKDEIKTFVSVDLMLTFEPVRTIGVRPGFGLMWDFSSIMGVWIDAGGTFGIGWGRRFGGEITVGFQARSYLLE